MCHHTRFMQRRLPIEDQYVPILQMPVNLLVDCRCPGMQTLLPSGLVTLWGHQLVRNGSPLFYGEFILYNEGLVHEFNRWNPVKLPMTADAHPRIRPCLHQDIREDR